MSEVVVSTAGVVGIEDRVRIHEKPLCASTVPGLPESAGRESSRTLADAPRDVLSRKFRVDGVIASGGMGIVVAAHHLALDKRVAIKLMRPELRARKDLVRRFLREARAAARLSSRHVTRVFDVGTLEDGAPYIVMEYLDGIDLAAWLRQRVAVPVPLAAAIVVQASDAIVEAHAAGIIHRDLKPSNLFLTQDRDGESLVKVLDLGICKLLEPIDDLRDTSISGGPGALGTPRYMAPEQLVTAHRADERSDVWSLGVILYELVAGRAPFQGRTVAELRLRAMRDPYPAMNHPDVPAGFEAVIARCLAKDPSERFARVADLAAALASFAQGVRPESWVRGTTRGRARPTIGRRTLAIVVAGALGASGAVALAWPAVHEPTMPIGRPEIAHPALAPRAIAAPPEAVRPAELPRPHVEPAPAPAPSRSQGASVRPSRASAPKPTRKRGSGPRPSAGATTDASTRAPTEPPAEPLIEPPIKSPAAADDPLANPD